LPESHFHEHNENGSPPISYIRKCRFQFFISLRLDAQLDDAGGAGGLPEVDIIIDGQIHSLNNVGRADVLAIVCNLGNQIN
jgi:hypothetical protein